MKLWVARVLAIVVTFVLPFICTALPIKVGWVARVVTTLVAFVLLLIPVSRWRHEMETFSALLALCAKNSPVTGEFPAQRPVTRSFDVFFDLRLNTRLSKQSWGRWFETPSRPLWPHCTVACTCGMLTCGFPVKMDNGAKTRPCHVAIIWLAAHSGCSLDTRMKSDLRELNVEHFLTRKCISNVCTAVVILIGLEVVHGLYRLIHQNDNAHSRLKVQLRKYENTHNNYI